MGSSDSYKRNQQAQTARRVDERTDRHRPDGGLDDQYDDRVERDGTRYAPAHSYTPLDAFRTNDGRVWVRLDEPGHRIPEEFVPREHDTQVRVERDDRGQFLCCAGNDTFGHQAGCPVPALEAEVARLRRALKSIAHNDGEWCGDKAREALKDAPAIEVSRPGEGAPTHTTTPGEEPQHGGG